jgi:hypothetical protein
MGVGIYVRSKPLAERKALELRTALLEAAPSAFDDSELNGEVRVFSTDDKGWIRFLVGEEDVELCVADERLKCSAKTSSLGPGYHAFLVKWLKSMDSALGIGWDWQDKEYRDETGYALDADFANLKNEMIRQLRGIAGKLLENPDYTHIRLNVTLDFPQVLGDYFALSQLGYFSREWFERLYNADEAEAALLSPGFYAWWNDGLDADFWRRYGLLRMWTVVRWNCPANGEDAQACRFTLRCFERARALKPDIDLPEREIAELEELLVDAEDVVPNKTGIGFFRNEMLHAIGEEWTLKLPGYYHTDMEDQGQTVVYWFQDRTVRITTLAVTRKDGTAILPDALLKQVGKGDVPELTYENEHLRGSASFRYVEDEEEAGESYLQLDARMASTNLLCLITVCLGNEDDREWALEVWRSATCPKQ